MKSTSRTRGAPVLLATSSRAKIALQTPMMAAMSPLARTWWYCVLILVSVPVAISTGDCGFVKRSRPRSRRGLNVMIGTFRRRACCRSCSMRGEFEPTFCPKKKMQSVFSKSSRSTVPTGAPMDFRKRHGRGLVAHVRTVGEVVVAVKSREQPVHVAGLERGPARGVEDGGLRIGGADRLQLASDVREGLGPGNRDVTVARRVVPHRVGEPSLFLEVEVGPGPKVAHRVLGEEIRRAALFRDLPGRRLRAVLAELEDVMVSRAWPRRSSRT